MKQNRLYLLLLVAICFAQCTKASNNVSDEQQADSTVVAEAPAEEPKVEIPFGAQCLIKAYPDWVVGYEDNFILLKDSTRMQYDDGKEKDFVTKLDYSDLEDMFTLVYARDSAPGYLQDAGRSRCEPFFKKMYGSSSAEVQTHLTTVNWFGKNVRITKVNGADKQLRKVMEEVSKHPELAKYLESAGSFYWRQVRGANRLSAHSYGIAIDIAVGYYDYWLWKNKGKSETDQIKYFNRVPVELIEIFEKYGFVSGARWYHFDTMHFEYRPEILEANPKKK